MIPSWLTQISACWSLTCAISTDVDKSESTVNEDDISTNKRRRKNYRIGKVLSTLTSSTGTSFSLWTDSFISNSHCNEDIMVFRKTNNCINDHQGKKMKPMENAIVPRHRYSKEFTFDGTTTSSKTKKKNEMLYPVSPYDELPHIRDLFEQLSPQLRPGFRNQEQIEELRQEHQNIIRQHQQERQQISFKKKDSPSVHQPRDRPPVNTCTEVSNVWTMSKDAHEVPIMIEIPSSPVYSEDSELSLDENLWQNDEDDDERDQRSLTPHPSYEDELQYQSTTITATEFHYLYHASVKVDQELVCWPSDEDDNDVSYQKKMIVRKKSKKTTKLNRQRHHQVRLV